MDNIFTFDEDDGEPHPFAEFKENESSDGTPTALIRTPFVFDEDNSEHEETTEKFKSYVPKKKKPLLESINRQNKLKKDQSEGSFKSKPQGRSLFRNFEKQEKNTIKGVEVEDVNVRDMEYVCDKKAIKVTDLRKFLNTPLGDYKVKAILKKQDGGFFNTKTKFSVYIQQNNKFLMTVLRDGLSDYIFSLSRETVSTKNKNYLGMMSGNLSGTEFSVYDSGFSPKETRSLEQCRKQLATIRYEESKGPRKFQVVVATNGQGFYALQPQHNVVWQKWVNKDRDYLSRLYSRSPEFDLEDGNYKLDFKGIVKKASVKNFILGGLQWQDSLIFGKIDDETFVMEIKQPLSVLQATAICISSIQYKLHWG